MKAIRKSDGKVIEVREWRDTSDVVYSDPDMNRFYQASELDFNVEMTFDGWVARDKNGLIYAYTRKPTRLSNFWLDLSGGCLSMPTIPPFSSLTWESDPIEVSITIKPKAR